MEESIMKSRRNFAVMVMVLLFVLGLSFSAQAVEVTAIGEGKTKQEAVANALRAAMEQALGAKVSSTSEVGMGKLNVDRIVSASGGYVKRYEVLAESGDAEFGYKVKVKAVLDDAKKQSALEAFMEDSNAKKTFVEDKFHNRKVVVIYKKATGLDLPYESKAVQTVMSLIRDKLTGHGFRVFMPEQLSRIKERLSEGVIDEETAINMVRQEQADAIVMVNFDAGQSPTSDGYNMLLVTLHVEGIDPTTGEHFASVQDRDKTVAKGGDYGLQDGLARAAIKVGPRVVDNLVGKIVERFSTTRQNFVNLMFQNVNSKQIDQIEDIISDTGWKYRLGRHTGNYVDFEIYSEGDPTTVRNVIRKALRKANMNLEPVEAAGSRVVFKGTSGGGF
jgi:hypothetical protein